VLKLEGGTVICKKVLGSVWEARKSAEAQARDGVALEDETKVRAKRFCFSDRSPDLPRKADRAARADNDALR